MRVRTTSRYDSGMSKAAPAKGSGLFACPFCRELYVDGEVQACPECGIALRDLTALPPSPDAEMLTLDEAAARPIGIAAQHAEALPWLDMSRGRGVVLAIGLAGFATFFFAPWLTFSSPSTSTYTAFHMAKSSSFLWSTLVAWMILIPAVASRRTIMQMVGARVVCAVLGAIPAIQGVMLLSAPTRKALKYGVTWNFDWRFGIYVSMALSVAAVVASLKLGWPIERQK